MAPAQTAPRGEPAAARAGPTAGAPSVANATRLHVVAEEASMPHRLNNHNTLAAHSDLTINTDSIVGELTLNAISATSSIAQRFRAQRASSTLHYESASSAPISIDISVPAASSPSASGADPAPATIAARTDSSPRSSSESSATRPPLGGPSAGSAAGSASATSASATLSVPVVSSMPAPGAATAPATLAASAISSLRSSLAGSATRPSGTLPPGLAVCVRDRSETVNIRVNKPESVNTSVNVHLPDLASADKLDPRADRGPRLAVTHTAGGGLASLSRPALVSRTS
ncbi:hypothetical protein OAO87_00450 [bacterium]|nr:hypothetical protein [bacterium]